MRASTVMVVSTLTSLLVLVSYWRAWTDTSQSVHEQASVAGGAVVLVTACLFQVALMLRSRRPAPSAPMSCRTERMLPVNKFATAPTTALQHTVDVDTPYAAAPPRRAAHTTREALAMPVDGIVPGADRIPIRANNKYEKLSLRFGMEDPEATDFDNYAVLNDMFGNGTDVPGLYQPGDMIEGTLVSVSNSGVLMDAGMKDYAIIPWSEATLSRMKDEFDAEEMLGKKVKAKLMMYSNADMPIASIRTTLLSGALDRLQQCFAERTQVELRVLEENRGGFVVLTPEGVRAFIPRSRSCGEEVGDICMGTILELIRDEDDAQVKVVFSTKDVKIQSLNVDTLVTGTVGAHRVYGTFINDLNGIKGMNGLLHISQTSFSRVPDAEAILPQVFPLGMEVKCVIMSKAGGRIELGTKVLEENPGDILKDPKTFFEKADASYERYLSAKSMNNSLDSLIGNVLDDSVPLDNELPSFADSSDLIDRIISDNGADYADDSSLM